MTTTDTAAALEQAAHWARYADEQMRAGDHTGAAAAAHTSRALSALVQATLAHQALTPPAGEDLDDAATPPWPTTTSVIVEPVPGSTLTRIRTGLGLPTPRVPGRAHPLLPAPRAPASP